ncbi:MAG: hypothetical protein IJU19_09160 [Bacteroidales bacterium]|nr:hypothetical protein [Bacteroidales bacterium]
MSTCNLTIESLANEDFCQNKMSGVKLMYFIPQTDVTAINATLANVKTNFVDYVEIGSATMEGQAFTVASGKGFAKLYCTKDLGELKYAVQGAGVGSRSFKATLEVFHPSFKKKILGFLGTMINQEMIVVVVLNNGEIHLLGDLYRGAQVADGVEATSGKAVTDQNGLTLNIEWDTPMPQIFYEGWSPEDATHGLPLIAASAAAAEESEEEGE